MAKYWPQILLALLALVGLGVSCTPTPQQQDSAEAAPLLPTQVAEVKTRAALQQDPAPHKASPSEELRVRLDDLFNFNVHAPLNATDVGLGELGTEEFKAQLYELNESFSTMAKYDADQQPGYNPWQLNKLLSSGRKQGAFFQQARRASNDDDFLLALRLGLTFASFSEALEAARKADELSGSLAKALQDFRVANPDLHVDEEGLDPLLADLNSVALRLDEKMRSGKVLVTPDMALALQRLKNAEEAFVSAYSGSALDQLSKFLADAREFAQKYASDFEAHEPR